MPGLIRKLVIVAAVDGLILQSHSSWDLPQGLLIDYKTRRLSPKLPQPAESYKSNLHLESHGVIGTREIEPVDLQSLLTCDTKACFRLRQSPF